MAHPLYKLRCPLPCRECGVDIGRRRHTQTYTDSTRQARTPGAAFGEADTAASKDNATRLGGGVMAVRSIIGVVVACLAAPVAAAPPIISGSAYVRQASGGLNY